MESNFTSNFTFLLQISLFVLQLIGFGVIGRVGCEWCSFSQERSFLQGGSLRQGSVGQEVEDGHCHSSGGLPVVSENTGGTQKVPITTCAVGKGRKRSHFTFQSPSDSLRTLVNASVGSFSVALQMSRFLHISQKSAVSNAGAYSDRCADAVLIEFAYPS